jgi:hypothetical protein
MRIRTLAGALAMSGLVALQAPAAVEAAHRHSRSCGHDRGYSPRSYRSSRYSYDRGRSYRSYSYRPPYRSYGYRSYRYRPYRPYAYSPYAYAPYAYSGYGYDPYSYDGYYPPPRRGHYHGRLFCLRPHFSIHIGF